VGALVDPMGLAMLVNIASGKAWITGYSNGGLIYKAFWKLVTSGYVVIIDNGYRKGKRVELTDKGKAIIADLEKITREGIREEMTNLLGSEADMSHD
jgi:DNA-binding PadR family transcriptional regulator